MGNLLATTIDPETETCGLTFQINNYGSEDPEYDSCGASAVACGLDDAGGRCIEHIEDFMYLEAWGFVPKPKFVFWILDAPPGFINDVPNT